MSTGLTKMNPYSQMNRVQLRNGSMGPKVQVKRRLDSDLNSSQITPSQKVGFFQIQYTPTNFERCNIDMYEDKSKPSDSSMNSTQLRKSPSFRMKNYRHITPGARDDIRRQTNFQSSAFKQRVSAMELLQFQLGTDDEQQQVRHTQPIKKIMATPSSSSQTTSVPKYNIDQTILEDNKDANLEEVHFFQVEMQQQYKRWLENIEKKLKK
ncbi:unnamed protein product [Paramecium sonneborni]|uniref:Uncharacterized protein n=1 Tax=Paramecium sonneborni TaxID=65129 RepID=A0A8S1M3A2_9CILI|nr:unnamed protein product [Paramecium sonneborni]